MTVAGRLHDLGSGAITVGILGAALGALFAFERAPAFRRWTLSVIAFAVITDTGLLAVGMSVGGLRQRLLVVAACVWQGTLITRLGGRVRIGRLVPPLDSARPSPEGDLV
jgi:hypothetical protein